MLEKWLCKIRMIIRCIQVYLILRSVIWLRFKLEEKYSHFPLYSNKMIFREFTLLVNEKKIVFGIKDCALFYIKYTYLIYY